MGRRLELRDLRRALSRERTVTLVGPGGVGKTRLAQEAVHQLAPRLPGGVAWADLAPLTGSAALHDAIRGSTEGLPLDGGALVVLDNCEHLRQAVAEAATRVVEERPQVGLLLTSRVPVGIQGELCLKIPPLDTNGRSATSPPATHSDAAALLLERIRRHDADFRAEGAAASTLADLAARLDGLPLALEIAAPWVAALGLSAVLERVGERLNTLTAMDDRAPRHRSLEAVMGWSYDLLTSSDRALLRRASVFRGLLAAPVLEVVCAGAGLGGPEVLPALGRLVHASLLTVELHPAGRARHRMLETVRHFGKERLQAEGEADRVIDSYCAAHVEFAEDTFAHRQLPDQAEWFERVQERIDDVFAAGHILLKRDPPAALQLAGAIGWTLGAVGRSTEGVALLQAALAAVPDRTAFRARACTAAALAMDELPQADRATTLLKEGLDIGEEVGDAWRVAFNLAMLAGDPATPLESRWAGLRRAASLADELGDDALLQTVRANASHLDLQAGLTSAIPQLEAGLADLERSGLTYQLVQGLSTMTVLRAEAGDLAAAFDRVAQALRLCLEHGLRGALPLALEAGAIALARAERPELALRLAAAAAGGRDRLHAPMRTAPDLLDRVLSDARRAAGGRGSLHERQGAVLEVEAAASELLRALATDIAAKPAATLKAREGEILGLVVEGLSNRQIAERLHLSVRTIEWYVAELTGRFGLQGRAALAAWASTRLTPKP